MEKILAIILVIVGMLACFCGFCSYMVIQDPYDYGYKMPDGTFCSTSEHISVGWGGSTHEFYRCDNGRKYINPDYYTRAKRLKKDVNVGEGVA